MELSGSDDTPLPPPSLSATVPFTTYLQNQPESDGDSEEESLSSSENLSSDRSSIAGSTSSNEDPSPPEIFTIPGSDELGFSLSGSLSDDEDELGSSPMDLDDTPVTVSKVVPLPATKSPKAPKAPKLSSSPKPPKAPKKRRVLKNEKTKASMRRRKAAPQRQIGPRARGTIDPDSHMFPMGVKVHPMRFRINEDLLHMDAPAASIASSRYVVLKTVKERLAQLKEDDRHVRADGFIESYGEYDNRQPYGREYNEEIDELAELVQTDPRMRFLDILAGALGRSSVTELYDRQDAQNVLRQNAAMQAREDAERSRTIVGVEKKQEQILALNTAIEKTSAMLASRIPSAYTDYLGFVGDLTRAILEIEILFEKTGDETGLDGYNGIKSKLNTFFQLARIPMNIISKLWKEIDDDVIEDVFASDDDDAYDPLSGNETTYYITKTTLQTLRIFARLVYTETVWRQLQILFAPYGDSPIFEILLGPSEYRTLAPEDAARRLFLHMSSTNLVNILMPRDLKLTANENIVQQKDSLLEEYQARYPYAARSLFSLTTPPWKDNESDRTTINYRVEKEENPNGETTFDEKSGIWPSEYQLYIPLPFAILSQQTDENGAAHTFGSEYLRSLFAVAHNLANLAMDEGNSLADAMASPDIPASEILVDLESNAPFTLISPSTWAEGELEYPSQHSNVARRAIQSYNRVFSQSVRPGPNGTPLSIEDVLTDSFEWLDYGAQHYYWLSWNQETPPFDSLPAWLRENFEVHTGNRPKAERSEREQQLLKVISDKPIYQIGLLSIHLHSYLTMQRAAASRHLGELRASKREAERTIAELGSEHRVLGLYPSPFSSSGRPMKPGEPKYTRAGRSGRTEEERDAERARLTAPYRLTGPQIAETRPEFTGIVKLETDVLFRINKALSDLNNYIPALRGITLDIVIEGGGLKNEQEVTQLYTEFAQLAAAQSGNLAIDNRSEYISKGDKASANLAIKRAAASLHKYYLKNDPRPRLVARAGVPPPKVIARKRW